MNRGMELTSQLNHHFVQQNLTFMAWKKGANLHLYV